MESTADRQNVPAAELRPRERQGASTLAGLGTAPAATAAPQQNDPQGCTTRSQAAAAAKAAKKNKKRVRTEPKEFPEKLILRCHRAGKSKGTGKRKTKLCGCPFRVEIRVVRDDVGNVVAFEYKEIGSHYGHVPGSEEDKRWLPKEDAAGVDEDYPMVADEEKSEPSAEEDDAVGGDGM